MDRAGAFFADDINMPACAVTFVGSEIILWVFFMAGGDYNITLFTCAH